MNSSNHVILIVIDDLRADQFNSLLQQGELPYIQKYLADGIRSDSTGCYPGITFPAQTSLLTGVYPDSYQAPGGHWVIRDKKIIRNYNTFKELNTINKELGTEVPTIFELVKGNTAGIAVSLTRGCSQNFPTKSQIFRLYLWHFIVLRRTFLYFNEIMRNKALDYFNKPRKFFKNGEPPRLTVAWFITSDGMLHEYGSDSENYLNCLKDIDAKIGELIEGKGKRKGLKELGYFNDTTFILTSDHGNYKAKEWIDIEPYFNKVGLFPLIPKKQDGNFDATFGSLGFFNLRGDSWLEHPTNVQLKCYGPQQIDLLRILLNIPGVKYLYYREDGNSFEKGKIRIIKKENEELRFAAIEYQKDKTRYIFDENDEKDVYRYSEDDFASKMLDEKFHSIQDWLQHTHHIDFPMIVDQIPRLFRNPNFCDIMVSTCGETIFNYEHGITKNNHIYGHDIGLHSAITVPLLISGLNISQKVLPYSKSTDIVPTILKLLGESIDPKIIGIPLL
jgi:arylsulfatase A-like enzyme